MGERKPNKVARKFSDLVKHIELKRISIRSVICAVIFQDCRHGL